MKRTLLLVLIGVMAGCASGRLKVGQADGGEVVEAEGWTPYAEADLLGTKKRALVEAQKSAVEKVVGVYVSAKTRVSKSIAVNQNILANVKGYIKKYEVLSEKKEDGFYKTRIRAFVRYEKVGADLDRLGLIRPDAPPGNPKVIVWVKEQGREAGDGAGRTSSSVRKGLRDRGFTVIDLPDEKAFPASASAAAAEGIRKGADIVVRGNAEAHPLQIEDLNLGGFHSVRARVALEALRSDSGEVLASKVQEASALDPSAAIAQGKSLSAAGMLAGEALASELYGALSNRVTVVVRVAGMKNLESVRSLVDELRTQPDIAMAALKTYSPSGTEIVVKTEGFAGDRLAEILLDMPEYRFAVDSVASYRIEVRARF